MAKKKMRRSAPFRFSLFAIRNWHQQEKRLREQRLIEQSIRSA